MLPLTTVQKHLEGEITDTPEERTQHSTDTSLFSVYPAAVAYPKHTGDVSALVHFAAENSGVSLTARSAGTGMDGGALNEGIIVDFSKYFTHIGEFSSLPNGTLSVAVQPGVFYRDFERETRMRGFLMPSYPASRELCMVGGMVANNSGGELTLTYGKTDRYVKKLRAVLSDGNEYVLEPLRADALQKKMLQNGFEGDIYRRMYALVKNNARLLEDARPRVSKNSAGYALWDVYDAKRDVFDLTKLFVGSQGTLGLVTEATLSLVRPSQHSQMLTVFLDSFRDVGRIVSAVLAHRPTTFESYDDKTLRLAARFFWEFVRRLGVRNILALAWYSLPEAFSVLAKGFPKLVLQITFDGDDKAELLSKAKALARDLAAFAPRRVEIIRHTREMDEYWLIRRESFNLLRHKVTGLRTAPFIDDIVVPTECLSEFLPKLYAILEKYKKHMVHNIAGHIGNGNFHIIPLMDLSKKENREVIPKIAQEVYGLVFAYGGSATGEHNDGIIRTPFLQQQFGTDVYRLFEETKRIFDPRGIFNPGKKVGGTLAYAMEHIKRDAYVKRFSSFS